MWPHNCSLLRISVFLLTETTKKFPKYHNKEFHNCIVRLQSNVLLNHNGMYFSTKDYKKIPYFVVKSFHGY